MTQIVILNPNATDSMTRDMIRVAERMPQVGARITGLTNFEGPPSIQGEADAAHCMPGLFALAETPEARAADAIVIGCFDDTGLMQMRAERRTPVVGLGEASFLAATLATTRFAVLTTTSGSVPVIEANIRALGLWHRCETVRAAHIPVLELESRVDDLRAALAELASDTEAGAIVLGCAGMSTLARDIADPALPILIDPVRAAVSLAASVLQSSVVAA